MSHITFAFNNVPLLKLLALRGKFVTMANLDKIKEIDEKINAMKNQKSEELSRPVAAFITFESQEGYERACELKPKTNFKREIIETKYKFLGEPLCFWEAPEPTNIIWENRDKTFSQQAQRKGIVITVIFLLLLLAFMAFFFLKKQTVANSKIYPATVDCPSIDAMFPNSTIYQYFANIDSEPTSEEKGTGIYQCYCQGLKKIVQKVTEFDMELC